MDWVKKKDNQFQPDGFIPDVKSNGNDQDVSFVYKPGKEKDFQVLPSQSKANLVDMDWFGSWVVVVIFSWIVILGLVSLVGIEIDAPEIFVSLVASFVFALSIGFLRKRRQNSNRS